MTKNVNADAELIRALAEILNDTGLSEIEYGKDDIHVRVSKNTGTVVTHAAAPAPAAAPAAPAPAVGEALNSSHSESHANHPGVVTSPMVGVAYTSSEPGAPAFVQVGDTVSEGQVLLLIEAMKVFNQLKAPRAGKVSRILIETGSPVEFGEPLLIIE